MVYSSGIGTKDSDGFRTTGTKAETLSATAVIEWLHGDRVAFTNRFDQLAIKAWWSNGNIGMTGRSYLGTLATAAAFTGVNGLKTAIVEAGLSDYYPYYRENGLVVAPTETMRTFLPNGPSVANKLPGITTGSKTSG